MPLIDDINAALSELDHMASGRGDVELQAIHARLDGFRHALFGGRAPAAVPADAAVHDPNQPEPLTGDRGSYERGSSEESRTPDVTFPTTTTETESEVAATPAAQAHAEETGVDLTQVEGTGKDGTITKSDVQEAAKES